jgi:hypothetical protein
MVSRKPIVHVSRRVAVSRLRAEYQRSIENTTELAAVVEDTFLGEDHP